ncbi:MAG: hypothetical protein CL908_22915 [Deltaproteobacteria bacterium]|nr:hypothetical protein [Deltaproteobacteria bacterium]
MRLRSSLSLFSHPPDRGTNVAYFLGAIVPLVVLGIVIERHVLGPHLPGREGVSAADRMGTLGLFLSIGMLSLACFLVLRRLVRRAIDENRALALHDSLTGLPNRRRYCERLERAIERAGFTGEPVATCFIDLDGFKRINDTLGHRAGDQLLMQVAGRVLGVVRASDSLGTSAPGVEEDAVSVSRFGGDEFTLLLSSIAIEQDAGRIAMRVLDSLRKPFVLDGQQITISASIGIAIYPCDGGDPDTLLRNADTAMYSAKSQGRNTYRFFSSAMNEEAERKLEIERRLQRAIAHDEFCLYFQPIRSAVSGEVSSAEVLIRWADPELGWVPPSEFIPVAEDTGLIVSIGSWVLRRACEQARRWRDKGFQPIRLAVNVSGCQLRQPGFVDEVVQTLDDTGLDPHYLEFEITETTIMQEDERTDRAFHELHDLGISIALDDFGTGYSSLSYLRRFPIHRVKIDRSFVARIPDDAEDTAATAAIVAMAHHLLLSVVGEGVETLDQARSLAELGCDELQGYLISPPSSAGEFEKFLAREKGR